MKVQNKINDTIMLTLNSDTTASHIVLFIINIAAISSAAASAAVGAAAAVVSIAIVSCRFLVNCCVFPPPLPAPTIATVVCQRLATVAPATIADPVPSADTAASFSAALTAALHQPDFKF
jgi:hypothetical protein